MKNIIKLLFALCISTGISAQYDISPTSDFDPMTISINGTATFDIDITNLTLTGLEVPAGLVGVYTGLGAGIEASATMPPIGSDADKFDWTFLGNSTGWSGISNAVLPTFGVFELEIPVTGIATSSNTSTVNTYIVPPDGNDTAPGNNGATSTLTVDSTTPVKYTRFGINSEDCSGVALSWSTAQEVNNEGFYIERSISNGDKFEQIGFVKGSNKLSNTDYSFKDDFSTLERNPEVVYYRLRQVDFNGNEEVSDILRAKINCEEVLSISGYPNPVLRNFNIEVNGLAGQNQIVIFNNTGQLVQKMNIKRNMVNTIDMGTFKSGLYTLNVLNDNNEIEKSMKVIKISEK